MIGTTDAIAVLEKSGSKVRQFLEYLTAIARLAIAFGKNAFKRPFSFTDLQTQCIQIGVESMPIAGITLLFVGFVFAFQFGITLKTMGAAMYLGKVTSLSIIRELGPVFTAIVVGGRVGAGIAAEIGSMKVTEQIDAIRALGASPYQKLLVPRVWAATLMLPLITIIAIIIGIAGAMMIAWLEFNVTPLGFYKSALSTIKMSDFASGFFKPFFFGFGIAVIGCHHGFECESGTAGVGKATTRAVVNVSLMIVLMDFLLTRVFALHR